MQTTALLLLTAWTVAAAPNGTLPRSFGVIKKIEVITYEPFDYPYDGTLGKGNSSHGAPCNRSFPNGTLCNRTTEINTLQNDTRDFLRGSLVTRFIPTVYTMVFLVSIPLNALALVVFRRVPRRKPGVVYMSNLALTDLLFGLVLPLKVHYYASGPDWVYGEVACRVVTAAFYGYMNCSVLLVMCMSVDRMLAVVFPIKSLHWRNPQNAALVCAGAWVLGLVAALPLLTIKQTMEIEQVGTTCHDVLEKDPGYLGIFVSFSCLLVFLPLIVTLTCYGVVIHFLRAKKSFQGGLMSSSLSMNRRKKATIMVFAVSLEFVLCFVPTNIVLLLHCVSLGLDWRSADAMYAAYMLAVCVGSGSACLDPLLYYFGSSQCRQQISAFMCWRKRKQGVSTSDSSSTRGHYSQPSESHTDTSNQ